MDAEASSRRNLVWGLGIAAAACLAYANSFHGTFIFDDFAVIRNNTALGRFLPLAFYPRWVVDLTFKLNYVTTGLSLPALHATNLAIHTGAALLFFGILRRTLLLPWASGRYERLATPLAGACAALWAVHPLQTESVTYLCQRYESMMGLCVFLALYCFIRGAASARPRAWNYTCLMVCGLGMGTKEVFVTTPVLLLLYDWVFRPSTGSTSSLERWRVHLPLFATLGIYLALHLSAMAQAVDNAAPVVAPVSPLIYLFTQFNVILHYLRLTLVPHPLCIDYGWPPLSSLYEGFAAGGLLLIWGILTLALLGRRAPAGYAGAWFFLLLAPTSSILPSYDMAFEHRMYLPLAGILPLLILPAYRLLAPRVTPPMLAALAGAVALALAGLSFDRNRDYRSEEAMWQQTVEIRPGNLRARNNYAVSLSEVGKSGEAALEYQRVLNTLPADWRQRLDGGEITVTGALSQSSIEYNYYRARANLGLLMQDAFKDRREAIRNYAAALKVWPYNQTLQERLRGLVRQEGVPEAQLEAEIAGILEKGYNHDL